MDKRILKMLIEIVDLNSSWVWVIQLSLSNTLFDLIKAILPASQRVHDWSCKFKNLYRFVAPYGLDFEALDAQIYWINFIYCETWITAVNLQNIFNFYLPRNSTWILKKSQFIRHLGSKPEILFSCLK